MVGRGKPGHFGPAVIGDDDYEEEQKILERGENTFGPGVTGDASLGKPVRRAEPLEEPAAAINAPVNLEEFRKQLFAADQKGADALLAAELARGDGPRKTALTMLLEAEEARSNGGRAAFLDAIRRGLGAVTAT